MENLNLRQITIFEVRNLITKLLAFIFKHTVLVINEINTCEYIKLLFSSKYYYGKIV